MEFSKADGRLGVAIGEEHLFLAVERRGRSWGFRLADLHGGWTWRTAWATLEDPEALLTARRAKPIRDVLRREYPGGWEEILSRAVGEVQDHVEEWSAREPELKGAGAPEVEEASRGREGSPEAPGRAEDPELRRRAEELLRDPRLLYLIGQEIGRRVKGEEGNRLLMWLLELTCQDADGYAFQTVVGESAVGKTTLARETLRYVPKRWWRRVGRISRTALEYLRDQDFQLLWIQEARGGEEAAPSIRLSSADDGGLEVWVTERDPETGRFATTEIHLPGRSVITTTTQVSIDPQDATRSWLISADASPEQTGRIIDYKLHRAAEPPQLLEALGRAPGDLAPVIQQAVSLLDYGAAVVVAYADDLRALLSNQVVRARRDVDKILGLISIMARLHQRQRPLVEVRGRRFIYATAADALMAFELGGEPLQETLTGLERRLMEAYRAVERLREATNTTVARELGKGYDYARRSLTALVNMGYVDVDESGKTHTYTVRADKAADVSRDRQLTLQASILQKKVETALSTMSAHQPPDGAVIHVQPITPETGYFSPTSGEWRAWEADRNIPAPPSADELLSGHHEPAVERPAGAPVWEYYPVRPGEKCPLCGAHPVVWEVRDPGEKTWLRRCDSCLQKMRETFRGAEWRRIR